VLSAAAYLEGEYGINGFYLGVPIIVGAGGVEKIIQVKLLEAEQAKLMNSLAAVKTAVDDVDKRI